MPLDRAGVAFETGRFAAASQVTVTRLRMLQVESLIERVRSYQPAADADLIKRAYGFSAKATFKFQQRAGPRFRTTMRFPEFLCKAGAFPCRDRPFYSRF